MASFITPKVGDIIYERPTMPGIVLSIVEGDKFNGENTKFEVLWMNGTKTIIDTIVGRAKSFLDLIGDHEKKLATHRKNLGKLIKATRSTP